MLQRLIYIPILVLLAATTSVTARAGNAAVENTGTSAIPMPTPAGERSAQPHLAVSPQGQVVLNWLEPSAAGITLRFSTMIDGRWSAPRAISSGDDWFVNWADFPSVKPLSNDLWAAHWLVRSADTAYAYDVVVAMSEDQGTTWSTPVTVHRDGTPTEHGFVSLFADGKDLGVVWLDGRNMAGSHHGEHSHGAAGMTLRAASVDTQNQISKEQLIDDLVCDCCQTDVVITAEGPVVVYRDRSDDEVRDIYIVKQVNGTWQTPDRVSDDNWVIDGCPVNGPAIAANASSIVVAWFTGADDAPRTRLAWSRDNGERFSNALDLDLERSIGRVDVALLDNGDAIVSWLRKSDKGAGAISIRRVSQSGDLGPILTIASTSTARRSGFPQMVRDGQSLIFAWTDVTDGTTTVNSARVAVEDIPTAP
ncbi:MAG: sialidase family protein [Pseudomonadota bacterium]